MLIELLVSLFSILLLPSLHNIVYTLFLYFWFLGTGFSNLLIFSLPNKFHSFDVFHSPSLSSSRSKISDLFSICFRSCRFSFLVFFFSSAIRLVFIHSNTVKSCFQAYVLSSPKILYFFSEKKSCNAVSGLISQIAITTVGFQFK